MFHVVSYNHHTMHTPTKLTESGYAYRTKKKIPKKHNYLGKEETQATEKKLQACGEIERFYRNLYDLSKALC